MALLPSFLSVLAVIQPTLLAFAWRGAMAFLMAGDNSARLARWLPQRRYLSLLFPAFLLLLIRRNRYERASVGGLGWGKGICSSAATTGYPRVLAHSFILSFLLSFLRFRAAACFVGS